MRDGEHALSPPPIFPEGKAAEGGGRLEAGSDLTVCGAGPLPSAIISKESESAKVRTLFRKQLDRLKPVGVQVLRSPPLARSSKAERSPDKRGTTERYRPGQPVSEG